MNSTKLTKVVRVVTTHDAATFHLKNYFHYLPNTFSTIVLGDNVESLASFYPSVRFINVPIAREISPLRDFYALILLIFIFAKEKPDVVHSIMPKAGLLCALAGSLSRVPVRIHTFTGQRWATATGLSRHFLKLLDKLVVKLNVVTLTDSYSQSQFLFENGIDNHGSPLPVLLKGSLSGVNLNQFSRKDVRPTRRITRDKLGIGDDEVVFLFVGRKCRDKGVLDLIEGYCIACSQIKKIRLLLVGPDESDGMIENLITSSNAEIINLPKTENPEIYFAASDIFCLPSYREGFGTTVIEAAAMGLPSIGTNIPGLVDSIKNGVTGILVPPGNIAELSNAMLTLASDTALRNKLSQAAYDNAIHDYNGENHFEELIRLYQSKLSVN